jgi:flagellar biosynthesis protein FlhB
LSTIDWMWCYIWVITPCFYRVRFAQSESILFSATVFGSIKQYKKDKFSGSFQSGMHNDNSIKHKNSCDIHTYIHMASSVSSLVASASLTVCFVDIGRIFYHHCFNFIFIRIRTTWCQLSVIKTIIMCPVKYI